MDKQIKLELVELEKLSQRAKSANRLCLEKGCLNKAINSHILQKNGILNAISTDGHLYALKFYMLEGTAQFKKLGLNNVFTFKGFCNQHDTALFDEIENKTLDFELYRTKLLLSYRAILNEARKKQVNIDTYNSIKSNNVLYSVSRRMPLDDLINNELLGQNDLLSLANLIRSDIDTGAENFFFATTSIAKVEICTSSTFSIEIRRDMILKRLSGRWEEPVGSMIINVIPYNDRTFIILGCHKSIVNRCAYFFQELDNNATKFTSDILIKNIETWVCSPSFYLKNIRLREKAIIKEFSAYPQQRDYTQPTRVSLLN